MIAPEVLDALLACGATAEMIVAAVKADAACDAAQDDKRLAKDRDRKRVERAARRVVSVDVHGQCGQSKDISDTPPNDIYSNPPQFPPSTKVDVPPSLSDRVVLAWNDGPAKLGATSAKSLDPGRRRALAARVKDHGEASVFEAIAHLAASKFHCGDNDRGWKANLGWLLKSAENFLKALEMSGELIPAKPDSAKSAENIHKTADFYEKIGRHHDAGELRKTATGPPRQIGQIASQFTRQVSA